MRPGLIGLALALARAAPAAAAETVTTVPGAPARNEFLQTVVPFLRKLRRSAP